MDIGYGFFVVDDTKIRLNGSVKNRSVYGKGIEDGKEACRIPATARNGLSDK